MRRRLRLVTVLTAAGSFIAASGVGFIATNAVIADAPESSESSERRADTSESDPATSHFPVNRNGQAYGSDAEVDDPRDGPDLVAVIGDSGIFGYVKSDDLNGPEFSTPEEAIAWATKNTGDVLIDVYDVDGEKVVDTFTLVSPETEEW